MGKIYFLFGVHNHQPVGNLPSVFEKAYQQSYLPFISLIEKFPAIKINLHNSGCLYDWLIENKREYIQILKKLVKRRQVEIISGGYYEPILPLISDKDRKGQINFMNDFIRREFKVIPQGIWVAERVWEPYLARIIGNCHLKYTFLDDTHFRYAGLREREYFGYYTTEEEGKMVYVFPISKTLRYKIPFSPPQEVLDTLKGFAKNGDVLVTLFDDGEKFGLWPHTYDWVYKKGWLKDFLSLLEKSSDIETITAAAAIKKFSSQGLIYIPAASYEEMGEWVLEPEAYAAYERLKDFLKEHCRLQEFKDFIRGGFFRNFYRKYSRLNYLYRRMFSLSRRINSGAAFKKDKKIFINLWKAQANCGYWHGIFGGFYLGHIRGAIYENLIRAENLWDKKHTKKELALEEEDIDLDGNKETIVKNRHIICTFSRRGGALLELSLRRAGVNLINTITRRRESYHKKIKERTDAGQKVTTIHSTVSPKEEGLDKFLVYDRYERLALIDHLLDKKITLDDFNRQRGIITLSNRIYPLSIKRSNKRINLLYRYQEEKLNFLKRAEISLSPAIDIFYEFPKKNILNIYNFGIEFNLFLPSLKDVFRREEGKEVPLDKPKEWKNLCSLAIIDKYKRIVMEFEHTKADIFSLPLYSISSSESGLQKVYQQITFLFVLKDKKDNFRLSMRIKENKYPQSLFLQDKRRR